MRKVAFPLLVIASSWNVCIVAAVAIDAEWVRTRAAGGQFETFPLFIRVIYGIEVLLIIAQLFFAAQLHRRYGAWSVTTFRLGQLLIVLYGISTVLNALSRSSAERLNAPVALICMWAFYMLVGRAKPISR